MKITIVALRVLDQDSALKFYTETLGFTQTEDMDLGGMRWLTVAPPDQPELNILLERVGPPFVDGETAAQLDALVAKGAGGTLFFQVEDVRGMFDRLVDQGVEIIQEPIERFYGTDIAIRDDSGNQLRINEPTPTNVPWPEDSMTARAQAAAE